MNRWMNHMSSPRNRPRGTIKGWVVLSLAILFLAHQSLSSATNEWNDGNDKVPNIHAIIVSSSRYWFNYRHAMNALGMYEVLRQNGIPKENVVLMIADEYATNARNPYKNRMYASGIHRPTWYSNYTELDYRGSDVTVQIFVNALLGVAPRSLRTNSESNLLIYVTGHGGDQFFKFQDEEELTAQDIANVMDRLHLENKFKQVLFLADTCQAFTLFDKVNTPNVLSLGTSLRGENAYAHHSDKDLGLAVIERWTHAFLGYYHDRSNDKTTLEDAMVLPFASKQVLGAHIGTRDDHSARKFKDITLTEFFGVKAGGGWPSKNSSPPPLRPSTTQPPEILQIQPQSVDPLPRCLQRERKLADGSEPYSPSLKRGVDAHHSLSSTVEMDPTYAGPHKSFYYLSGGLFVALLVVTSLEKTLFNNVL